MPRFRRNRRSYGRDRNTNLVWVRDSSNVIMPASASGVLYNASTRLDTKTGRTVSNWTVERSILDLQLTVPAGTTPGRSYAAFLGLVVLEDDAVAAGAIPEPFSDTVDWIWIAGPRVYADHTVPASYASPGVPHSASHIEVDVRNKRRIKQQGQSLCLVGYHDNNLGANPAINFTYSHLFNAR